MRTLSKKKRQSKTSPGKLTSGPPSRPPLTRRKKLFFSAVSLLSIFLIVEVGLALVGVRPQLQVDDPFVGFSDQVPLLEERQQSGKAAMVTAPNKLKWFNEQSFLKQKSGDTYRVFALGGSTTYGRPYTDPTSFAGWLRELLPVADPSQKWEVINAGGISYASYRVVKVMEELAEFDPDLFVVYTGHNEFLEERTYRSVRQLPAALRNLNAILSHSRIYSAMYRLAYRNPTVDRSDASQKGTDLNREVKARLDQGVGPDAYQRDETLGKQVEEHFRFNLQRMIEIAQTANSEILFVTPASNLADCSPFKSQPAANESTESTAQIWKQNVEAAETALAKGDLAQAITAIEQALTADSRDASTQYLYGRILQANGEYPAAKQAFIRARDEDVCPLRAKTEVIAAVQHVADQNGVPCVDFLRIVDQQSQHQIPGAGIFLDHVHPTVEGHRLLALAIVDQLIDQGVVQPSTNWNSAAIAKITQQVESGIDERVQGEALRNLAKVLTWAGKKEEANRLALKASELLSGDDETFYLAGNALLEQRRTDEAIEQFLRALEIRPNHIEALNSLGAAYYQSGRTDEAIAAFQKVLQLDPGFVAVHNNLGLLLQGQKRYDEALKHFQEAIRINPRYAEAYNNLGVMRRSQNRLDEAFEMCQRAVEIDPQYAVAHFNIGLIRAMQRNPQSAMASFRDCLRINPKYGPAYHQMGILFEGQGQIRPAVNAYRESLRHPPASRDASRRLAWILATHSDDQLRNGAVALRLIQGALKVTSDPDALMLTTLAAAQAEVGDYRRATASLEQAIQRVANSEQRTQLEIYLNRLRDGKSIRSQR